MYKNFENVNDKFAGGNKLAPLAPVILGPVPRIFWQRVSNLVNKLALLNKCWERGFSGLCMFFKYPSPDAKASPSPSRGEVLNNTLRKGLDVVRQYAALLERRVQTGTRARKTLVVTRQANPLGRSMIEMLGVLAIVAVLTVGGIAGYSKAMTMWKIDKWKDNFTMMMTNLKVAFSNSRSYNNGAPGVNMVTFFKEINVIPDNMLDEDNKDLFGDILSIYAPEFSPEWNRLTFMFFMPPNKESVEVCKAFFSLTPDFRNMWTATLNDNLKIGNYELCGYGIPAEIAKEWNCKYYKDGILPQIAQSCAICSQYSCDLKLIISNNN